MILCCGEALIDMIPNNEGAFVPHAGGAVFNTAIALGRLSASAGLVSGVSTDRFGARLVEALETSSVATDFLCLSPRPTTLAFVYLRDGHAAYDFYDENTAGRMISFEEMKAPPKSTQALFFGGISLACMPSADSFAAYMQTFSQDHLIMLDPNIRPAFIADTAQYRKRLEQLFRHADIVKVSDEDLHWIVPGALTLQEKAEVLLEKGPRWVLVTLGADGVLSALETGETMHVSSPTVQVCDTVGAGDTFNAGVLAALEEAGLLSKSKISRLTKANIRNVLEFAVKVAAHTVTQKGANPPWRHQL